MLHKFPELDDRGQLNPRVNVEVVFDSHPEVDCRTANIIWYNNKISRQGTRDEVRLTRLGGRSSPALDPESTGAVALFVFSLNTTTNTKSCRGWVCRTLAEEDAIQSRFGIVEPNSFLVLEDGFHVLQNTSVQGNCSLTQMQMPQSWLSKFPTGEEIIRKTLELSKLSRLQIDERLKERRKCEYEIFQSVEAAYWGPKIAQGISNLNDLLVVAQSILQSRKSRGGKSLELHVKAILKEEGLVEHTNFEHNVETEYGKRPDFIFPSRACYSDSNFPAENLRMLATKSSCKDRWRQVVDEAARIPVKHLLTLQEGVSESQFEQMRQAGIKLVIPASLVKSFPKSTRAELITVSQFIDEVKSI